MRELPTYQPMDLTAEQAERMQDFRIPPEYIHSRKILEEAEGCHAQLKAALDCYDTVVTLALEEKILETRVALHNMCVLPMLGKVQALSAQCREEMPTVDVPYEHARGMLEETLYAAIKNATGTDHHVVNDIQGYDDEVALVVECLLNAEAQGHETHGVIRAMRYVEAILKGKLKPNAKVECSLEKHGMARFDGHGTFGQVAVQVATQHLLSQLAKPDIQTMTVTAFNMGHAGRLEFILRQIAEEGYQALGMFNVHGWGRTALPDCIDGHWGTNPIAIANSTGVGSPASVIDFATTAKPEGFVKVALQNGLLVPFGVLHTADGRPVMNPALLYAKEHGAFLAALGGEIAEYKGAALGMGIRDFVDGMNGKLPKKDEIMLGSNSLFLFAAKPAEQTHHIIGQHLEQVRTASTASGKPVRMPGEHGLAKLKEARRSALSIAQDTWNEFLQLHGRMRA